MSGKLLFWAHPNMMQLSYFIDKELRPEDMKRVAGHLKTCALCGIEAQRLRRVGVFLHLRKV